MSDVEIFTVATEADWKAFIDLPWRLYEGDPNWVPPIKKHVRRLLDPEKHPFWRFSQGALFLARRRKKIVGRIAGIIDNNYNQFRNEKMGAWGFFECENDPEAAQALFAAVEQWVAAKGMRFLRGPLNPSTNYEVGLLVEGLDLPPTFMMTYNPLYYVRLVESCGFRKEKDLLALLLTGDEGEDKRVFLQRIADRIKQKGSVRIRGVTDESFESEINLVKSIYDTAWGKHWGFTPMSDGELYEMAKNLKTFADLDFIFFVYYNDAPVGFCVIVPDINPLLTVANGGFGLVAKLKMWLNRDKVTGLRGLLFGFKQDYQRLGLPLVAFEHLSQLRRDKPQYKYLELGWNLEDNHDINQFELDLGAKIYKKYRVFRKDLR